ncbi:MAG TPA: Uma2 family endonuclease, partial [Polyangiaceae bacterium]|nr:Uma2 family endonuclease [Polyangiaceae bacterium]
MAAPAKRRATYADLMAVPEGKVAEILHGELYVHPRPALRHARVSTVLGGKLVGPLDLEKNDPGGWVFLFEPELHFEDDVLVPDLAAWRRSRMPEVPDVAALSLAPDWLCEVLSPSTAATDRTNKVS